MRAIVLSGGGNKGAFASGCIKYLLGDLQIKYDIICGISSGAINGSFLAQFPFGQEIDAANQLVDLWLNINTESIYKRWWPLGKLHAIWRPSFYDSLPLSKLINKHIFLTKIRESGKKVSVGVVSLNSGKYHIIDQNNDNFIDFVVAGSSFPGMFSPVKIGDHLWMDGSIKEISPIKTAIDFGADAIDVIITSPEKRIRKFVDDPSTIDVMKRAIDLSADKIMANDIDKVIMYNRLAEAGFTDKKYVNINIIRPDNNLTDDLLDFDPIKIREMLICGYNDAKRKYINNSTL